MSDNERMAALFRKLARTGETITRSEIVQAFPGQLDPLKRIRRNGGARDILDREGIAVVRLEPQVWTARKEQP